MDILKNKFVVVDLETTGSDVNRDYIIEIGAVKIENGEISETFSSFASSVQLKKLPEKIAALTGMTDEDLSNAPRIENVLAGFKEFADGYTLVAHNLPFDFAFLRNWGFWCGVDFDSFANEAIDAIEYAKRILGSKVKNYKLSTLAEYFGIEFTQRRVLSDVVATAQVFLRLAKS